MNNTISAHGLLTAARNSLITAEHDGNKTLCVGATSSGGSAHPIITITVRVNGETTMEITSWKTGSYNHANEFTVEDNDAETRGRPTFRLVDGRAWILSGDHVGEPQQIDLSALTESEQNELVDELERVVWVAYDKCHVDDASEERIHRALTCDARDGEVKIFEGEHLDQPFYAWSGDPLQRVYKNLKNAQRDMDDHLESEGKLDETVV